MTDRERVVALAEALALYGHHDTGCPGWYRAVRTPSDPNPPVKCFNDPCDCGLDAALALTPTNGDIVELLKYSVTLKTKPESSAEASSASFKANVEIEDRGGPVENNGAAIQAAIAIAAKGGHVVIEPLRVTRL